MARGQIEKRGVRRRSIKPVILIVTEGSQTEPKYFEHFRTRKNNVDIRVVGSRSSAGESDYISLVRKAVEYKEKNQLAKRNGDTIWVVADGDVNYGKTIDVYAELSAHTAKAIENSKRLELYQKNNGNASHFGVDVNPFTDVYKLVESLV